VIGSLSTKSGLHLKLAKLEATVQVDSNGLSKRKHPAQGILSKKLLVVLRDMRVVILSILVNAGCVVITILID